MVTEPKGDIPKDIALENLVPEVRRRFADLEILADVLGSARRRDFDDPAEDRAHLAHELADSIEANMGIYDEQLRSAHPRLSGRPHDSPLPQERHRLIIRPRYGLEVSGGFAAILKPRPVVARYMAAWEGRFGIVIRDDEQATRKACSEPITPFSGRRRGRVVMVVKTLAVPLPMDVLRYCVRLD